MKREIKFRMWNPLPSKMIYELNVVMECLKQQLFHSSPDPLHIPKYDHEGEYGAVFMQFTGLRDQNGVEIYEGDIWAQNNYDGVEEYNFIGIIDYHVDGFAIKCVSGSSRCKVGSYYGLPTTDGIIHKGETIGNIYQNPELLNGKEAGKV